MTETIKQQEGMSMTPEYMRQHSAKLFADIAVAVERRAIATDLIVSILLHQSQAQWEIAAQLAELNQSRKETHGEACDR